MFVFAICILVFIFCVLSEKYTSCVVSSPLWATINGHYFCLRDWPKLALNRELWRGVTSRC